MNFDGLAKTRRTSRVLTSSRREFLQVIVATASSGFALALAGSAHSSAQESGDVESNVRQLVASDFGTRGDGKSADTDALQAAMSTAAAKGVPLLIPPGDYVVARSLLADSNLSINAKGATFLTYVPELGDSGRNVPTLMIDGVRNVRISGLAINGRKDAFEHTEYKAGVCINNSSEIVIDNCDLY